MEEREPWGTLKPSAEAPASNSPASETYVTSLLYRSNIHPLITGHDRGQGQKRRKEERHEKPGQCIKKQRLTLLQEYVVLQL